MKEVKLYYIYKHTTLDTNQIFYIGRGSKLKNDLKYNRYSRAYNIKSRNTFWKNIVAKHGHIVDIIIESNDFKFICKKEKELVKFYGRRDLGLGNLVNLSDGGETSCLGRLYKPTKESIEKMRNSLIGRKMPEGFGEKVSERMKGNKYRIGVYNSHETYMSNGRLHMVSVYMYDLQGNFIKSFDSVKAASIEFNVHTATIIQCLKGIQKQTHDHQFKYEYHDKIDKVTYKISKNDKILHINLLTKEETVYDNIKDASKKLSIPIKKIYHNLYGECKVVEKFNVFKRIKNE